MVLSHLGEKAAAGRRNRKSVAISASFDPRPGNRLTTNLAN